MILYHLTPAKNVSAVLKYGLDPRKATGKIKGVWLATLPESYAMEQHIATHQSCELKDLVRLEVLVDTPGLRRFREGIYISYRFLPYNRLRVVQKGEEHGEFSTVSG